NLGAKPYPDQDFTAFIRRENASALKEKLPEVVAGDVVAVTGKITLHKGKPQIEVTDAAQVKVQTKVAQ
ncbi:hypothetical protein, partial [Salmonella sp. SAL4357]|uniref:hypothetical protein n=1 Tax=Salmonella sp. SAL4357 TaxID=3159878 RepID=UPI00397A6A93